MKKDKYIEYILWILAIILLFPALFVNLGLMPLNFPSDEPTRAIVALEMMISGDYIHPTINGELYYNKPPLFNWIIIFFNKITGNLSELTLRLPVTFSLLFYGLFIFLFTRKYYGNKTALLHALVFISCGRILFWDSFIGLIDISFSMIIFMLFMSVFYFFRKEKYNSLS